MADREREDLAEAERLRREEEKRRIEESIRRAEYDRKAKAVKALVQQWQESKLLRAFTAAGVLAGILRSRRIDRACPKEEFLALGNSPILQVSP